MSAPTRYVESSRYIGQEDLTEQTEGHLDEEQAPAPQRAVAPPRPYSAGRFASRRGGARHADRPERRAGEHAQNQQPSAGHAQAVPGFPDPLPGYHNYRQHDTVLPHQPLDVGPAEPYYSKGMAHGVVPPATPHGGRPAPRPEERAQLAATRKVTDAEIRPKHADPVPVTIVQPGGGPRPLRRAALRQVTIAASGADPTVLVPRNPHRRSVRLLNESASPVRLLFDLANTGGALLPASMSNYLEIDTADEICAYCPSTTASPGTQATQQATGTQTSPTAGTVITSIAGLAAGLWQLQWTVGLGGTTSATEANNFGLYVGATQVLVSMSGTVSGSVYPQLTVNVQVPAGGATASIQAIATATSGAVYRGQLVATPLIIAASGPSLVSVIEQYDVAGGT